MRPVCIRSYENGLIRAERLGDVEEQEANAFTNASVLSEIFPLSASV